MRCDAAGGGVGWGNEEDKFRVQVRGTWRLTFRDAYAPSKEIKESLDKFEIKESLDKFD
jgi:hypothetical protein